MVKRDGGKVGRPKGGREEGGKTEKGKSELEERGKYFIYARIHSSNGKKGKTGKAV